MLRFATFLLAVLTLALTTTTLRAQTGTISCDLIAGDLAITSISPTAISGTFSGDLVGSLDTTIDHVYTFPTPWGPAKFIAAHSTITTANPSMASRLGHSMPIKRASGKLRVTYS